MRKGFLAILGMVLLAGCGASATPTPSVRLTPPWTGAERAEYVYEAGGKPAGSGVFTVTPKDTGYVFGSETVAGPVSNITMTSVDKNLKPLGDTVQISGTGLATDVALVKIYDNGALRLEAKMANGTKTATVGYPPNTWDNDQLLMSIRALPLAVGYTFSVPIYAGSTAPTNVTIDVTGTETIDVPAGAFNTYKVALDYGQGKQYLWYAVDSPHYLIKYERPEGPQRLILTKVGTP